MVIGRVITQTPAGLLHHCARAMGVGEITGAVNQVVRGYRTLYQCLWLVVALGFSAGAAAISFNVPSSDTDGTFTISWSDPGAYMKLYERAGTSGSWTEIYGRGPGASSLTLTRSLGTYQYYMFHCHYTGPYPTCANTATMTITIEEPPAVPSLTLAATDNNGAYRVSWNSVSGATYYQWQEKKDSGSWSAATSSGSTAYVDRSGKVNAVWSYRVRSCNAAGCSNFSGVKSIIVANTPGVPASIAGSLSGSNIAVNWGVSSGVITQYDMDYSKDGAAYANGYNGTGRSKTLSGLGYGSFTFRVRACATVSTYTSCSGWRTSSTLTVSPLSPSLTLAATDNNGAYRVSWNSVSGATYYQWQEKKDSGSWSAATSSGSTAYVDRSGKANAVWSYRVRSCNAAGCSNFSGVKSIIVANTPGVPASIAGSISGSDIAVTWGISSGVVTKYDMDFSEDGGAYANGYDGSSRSKTLSGLGYGSFTFRVRACATVSTYTSCSGWRTSSPLQQTVAEYHYEYDELGRLVRVVDGQNRESTYDYDKADNRLQKNVQQLP